MASHTLGACVLDDVFDNACADTGESISVIVPHETFGYP
jgi:hypothetical protein